MLLYITVAVVTILIAGLVKPLPNPANSQIKLPGEITRRQMLNLAGLLFIFTILFVVSAIRLNVGNDYTRYVEFMHLIVHNAYVPTEMGFNGVVRIIYGLSGFENYLLVFAFFSFTTIAVFLWSIYRDSENFGLSFFLFMSFGLYFQSFSTVRYYLALAIALFAIPFVLKKKWVPFILLILLGATFHKSILIVIPLYFLASLKWKKLPLIAAGLFCTTFLFLQDFYLRLLVFVYPTYRDTEYLEGGTSIINIIRCGGILIFSLIYYREAIKDNDRNRFYFYCNLAAFALYTFGSFIPVISRIGFYLTVTHIFFIPALLNRIKDKKMSHIFTALIIAAGILYLAMYLIKAQDAGVRLIPYQTFLFHEMSFQWAY
ncbi:MAG: EpsG family protein [Lachnospiraceae bacterium]|nr:EpsG family protein [Lachnospiraceae bacterium]